MRIQGKIEKQMQSKFMQQMLPAWRDAAGAEDEKEESPAPATDAQSSSQQTGAAQDVAIDEDQTHEKPPAESVEGQPDDGPAKQKDSNMEDVESQ